MKEIKLERAATYDLTYRTRPFHFEKGQYYKVTDELAAKLLGTGDFVEIINESDFSFLIPPKPEVKSEPVVEQPKKKTTRTRKNVSA